MIIIAAVLGLYFRGLNFGIEFVGGAQYTVSMPAGEATQANADKLSAAVADTGIPAAQQVIATTAGQNSILVETEPLTPAESNHDLHHHPADASASPRPTISTDEIGPSWGKEVAKRSLIGLVRLPGPGGAPDLGLLPTMEDVAWRRSSPSRTT